MKYTKDNIIGLTWYHPVFSTRYTIVSVGDTNVRSNTNYGSYTLENLVNLLRNLNEGTWKVESTKTINNYEIY